MSEYWLISAPGDKTCQQTWETMNNLTHKTHNLCVNYKFHIPDLKVGTLDQLVGLSDDLGKLDTYVEQITRKVASYLGEVLEDQRDKHHENLLANNSPGPSSTSDNNNTNSTTELNAAAAAAATATSNNTVSHKKKLSLSSSLTTSLSLSSNHSKANSRDDNNSSSSRLCSPCNSQNDGLKVPLKTTTTTTSSSSSSSAIQINKTSSGCCSTSLSSSSETNKKFVNNGSCICDNENDNESITNSDYNDTFDWWFHKNKHSHKNRQSPVSCCGSSQGRSSPDGDINDGEVLGEPPPMPLSPADLPSYITRFQWDMAKYPIKQSLRNIADIISKQVGQIDADVKTKSTAYNNLKGNLQNLEKKQTGSLLTRSLADLVKKEHFILDSEYLTTLLVIVPKALANDWINGYEKITDMIVPRSSQMITQDQDYMLFNVTLFKKVVEEFKLHAREKKFVVRDFVYNEEELAAGKNEITKLVTDKKKQFGPLVRWLKINFSECFCAWIHVKALRVFVESVLRYGLPVNFQAILIHPNKKNTKRLRDTLMQLYGHLDGSASTTCSAADNVDIPGLGFGQSEYYPYVYYKLNIDMVEQKP